MTSTENNSEISSDQMSTVTSGTTISNRTDDCEWPSTISESPVKAVEPDNKRKKIATSKTGIGTNEKEGHYHNAKDQNKTREQKS